MKTILRISRGANGDRNLSLHQYLTNSAPLWRRDLNSPDSCKIKQHITALQNTCSRLPEQAPSTASCSWLREGRRLPAHSGLSEAPGHAPGNLGCWPLETDRSSAGRKRLPIRPHHPRASPAPAAGAASTGSGGPTATPGTHLAEPQPAGGRSLPRESAGLGDGGRKSRFINLAALAHLLLLEAPPLRLAPAASQAGAASALAPRPNAAAARARQAAGPTAFRRCGRAAGPHARSPSPSPTSAGEGEDGRCPSADRSLRPPPAAVSSSPAGAQPAPPGAPTCGGLRRSPRTAPARLGAFPAAGVGPAQPRLLRAGGGRAAAAGGAEAGAGEEEEEELVPGCNKFGLPRSMAAQRRWGRTRLSLPGVRQGGEPRSPRCCSSLPPRPAQPR